MCVRVYVCEKGQRWLNACVGMNGCGVNVYVCPYTAVLIFAVSSILEGMYYLVVSISFFLLFMV